MFHETIDEYAVGGVCGIIPFLIDQTGDGKAREILQHEGVSTGSLASASDIGPYGKRRGQRYGRPRLKLARVSAKAPHSPSGLLTAAERTATHKGSTRNDEFLPAG
jgi:hypothetical protein